MSKNVKKRRVGERCTTHVDIPDHADVGQSVNLGMGLRHDRLDALSLVFFQLGCFDALCSHTCLDFKHVQRSGDFLKQSISARFMHTICCHVVFNAMDIEV